MSRQSLHKQPKDIAGATRYSQTLLAEQQVEAMRRVVRRMQASKSITLDPVTHAKLGKIK